MKKVYILLLMLALAGTSCGRFDEYNTNPDQTTSVTSDMLATGAMLATFRTSVYANDAKAFIGLNAIPKYLAYLGEGALEAQYNSIGGGSFGTYTILPNLGYMTEYASGTIFESSYNGLALFIKAFNGFRMTMMMGDVPYSEAGRGASGLQTPVYDTQEQIFASILADLQAAEAQFLAGSNFGGDIMYDGDVDKWARVSNALQLKVILSLGDKATAEQITRFSTIVAAGNLMRNNDDNLCLKYAANSTQQHPLFEQTMFAPRATLTTVVVDALKELNDRRLFYFAEPSSALIAAGGEADDPNSYVGCDPSVDYTTLALAHNAGEYSIINLRYQNKQDGDPYMHLSYAEQCFIIAEAIEMGWITGTSATYYENGVRAALEMVASWDPTNANSHGMPIDQTYIDGYFTGEAAYKSSTADRLDQIRMQRYLTKFLQDGIDSYFDYRRTGYPVFPINPATSMNEDGYQDQLPLRWSYPSNETQTNEANLNVALARQFTNGYDGTNEAMWLLK